MPQMTFKTALITGASAGLGAEYARQLAAKGTNLVLVARRRERLDALAAELHAAHGVAVDVWPADLAVPDDIERIEAGIAGHSTLDLLVNNAGFGGRTGFVRGDTGDHVNMLRVHVDAAVRLAKAALSGMLARGRGGIINVASTAAFQAGPRMAVYYATKAYVLSFSEALAEETRGRRYASSMEWCLRSGDRGALAGQWRHRTGPGAGDGRSRHRDGGTCAGA